MATAGSGDVLAGIIASLLGQGVWMDDAVPLGVFVHGRAGDLACRRKGRAGMTAGDLLDALPAVWKHLQGR
jgi:NAD(P)H-hydrate epimerase